MKLRTSCTMLRSNWGWQPQPYVIRIYIINNNNNKCTNAPLHCEWVLIQNIFKAIFFQFVRRIWVAYIVFDIPSPISLGFDLAISLRILSDIFQIIRTYLFVNYFANSVWVSSDIFFVTFIGFCSGNCPTNSFYNYLVAFAYSYGNTFETYFSYSIVHYLRNFFVKV